MSLNMPTLRSLGAKDEGKAAHWPRHKDSKGDPRLSRIMLHKPQGHQLLAERWYYEHCMRKNKKTVPRTTHHLSKLAARYACSRSSPERDVFRQLPSAPLFSLLQVNVVNLSSSIKSWLQQPSVTRVPLLCPARNTGHKEVVKTPGAAFRTRPRKSPHLH